MPNHQTHDAIGVVSTLPIAGVALYLHTPVVDTSILAIGIILSTYFLSPDLDLYSRIYKRWGILRWIWLPYQHCIPHRSWLSHSGPISATIRIAYLLLWILPLILLSGIKLPLHDLHFIYLCGMLYLSVVIADTLHVFMDLFWKDYI